MKEGIFMALKATNIDYVGIGQRIRSIRIAKGYTQEYLAGIVDLSPSYMSNIENGTSKLALPSLINIAKALDTTVDTILYETKPTEPSAEFLNSIKVICTNCNDKEKAYLLQLLEIATKGFEKLK